jgi:hypothetical protein
MFLATVANYGSQVALWELSDTPSLLKNRWRPIMQLKFGPLPCLNLLSSVGHEEGNNWSDYYEVEFNYGSDKYLTVSQMYAMVYI